MRGTEGIDYVVTECGHCSGAGKCQCYDCRYRAAVRAVRNSDGKYYVSDRDDKIKYLKKQQEEVACSVCEGVGKVVFWRNENAELNDSPDG